METDIVQPARSVDLFLDSGAFSAFSQGITIDLDEYIQFIQEHDRYLQVYANLDVIGDPEATWRNQQYMEDRGLHPLPTFHYGEPIRYLERYVSIYPYVALGGMVPIKTADLRVWLDVLFSHYLCDERGLPRCKVHGFGLTTFDLMLRYPWYSVDSTSWVVTSRMGSIYIPRKRDGRWIYGENAWKVCVSVRSPNVGVAGEHITTLRPAERELMLSYIADKGYRLGRSRFELRAMDSTLNEGERWAEKKGNGKKPTRLVEIIEEPGICNQYQLRDEMNILYFLDLERSLPDWPWVFKLKNSVKGLGL